jgi:hypothetical protein
MLNEEQHTHFQQFIEEVKNDLCVKITSNSSKFPSFNKLLVRFTAASERLLSEGLDHLPHFIETHNELCVAADILEEPNCEQLDYELPIEGSGKLFDFFFKRSSGIPIWIEIKTIHPTDLDAWDKYERDKHLRRFGDVELILEEKWLGGELYHKAYASRSKILEYVIETEEKISECLGENEQEGKMLLFFSNGFDWHLDELEDFIYFYQHDKHLPEDTFGVMEEHHISDNGITLQHNINVFAYMERPDTNIRPRKKNYNVEPPKPYVSYFS